MISKLFKICFLKNNIKTIRWFSISNNLNSNLRGQTPFKDYKSKNAIKDTGKENLKYNQSKKVVTDMLLNDSFLKINSLLDEDNKSSTINSQNMKQIRENLWSTYLQLKKVIDNFLLEKNNAQYDKSSYSDPKIAEELKLSNLYFNNAKITDPILLETLNNTVLRFESYLEKHQDMFSSSLNQFYYFLKPFSKYEIFLKSEKFWFLSIKITNNLLSRGKIINEEEFLKYISILKSLLFFKAYTISKNLIYSENNSFIEFISCENKIFTLLENNLEKIPLDALAGLLQTYESNKDEDKIIKLCSMIIKYLQNEKTDLILKSPLTLAKSYAKLVKLTRNLHIFNLNEEIKKHLIKGANLNLLTNKTITMVMWTIHEEMDIITDEIFSLLWNNLYHNIYVKKSSISIHSISTAIIILFKKENATIDRYITIQDIALNALNQLNINNLNTHNYFDENSEEESGNLNLFIKSCVHILHTISNSNDFKHLSIPLINKLTDILMEKKNNLFSADLSLICNSLTKFYLTFNQDEHVQLKQKIKETLLSLSNFILTKIGFIKYIDLSYILLSYVETNLIDQKMLQQLIKTFINKFKDNVIPNLNILKAIYILDQTNRFTLPEITILREKIFNYILMNMHKFDEKIITRCLKIFENINEYEYKNKYFTFFTTFETKINDQLESFSLNTICYILTFLDNAKIPTKRISQNSQNTIIKKLKSANFSQIFTFLRVFITENSGALIFFEEIENILIQKLEKKIKVLSPSNHESQHEDQIRIFAILTKFKINNEKLIELFEKYFELFANDLSPLTCMIIMNSIIIYESKNMKLWNMLLTAFDSKINLEDHIKAITPNLAFQVHSLLFSLELEFKDSIDLSQYQNLCNFKNLLQSNPNYFEKINIVLSSFQKIVAEGLHVLKLNFIQEKMIGVYHVDFYIEPNIILETNGMDHFILNTKEETWNTKKKVRQLKKMGYKIVSIPYFEWEEFKFTEQKYKYLKDKINA